MNVCSKLHSASYAFFLFNVITEGQNTMPVNEKLNDMTLYSRYKIILFEGVAHQSKVSIIRGFSANLDFIFGQLYQATHIFHRNVD